MSGLGRVLIVTGALLMALGVIFVLRERSSIPLGRLPGDFTWRGKNTVVFFPLATSILLSILLSLVLYLISRFHR